MATEESVCIPSEYREFHREDFVGRYMEGFWESTAVDRVTGSPVRFWYLDNCVFGTYNLLSRYLRFYSMMRHPMVCPVLGFFEDNRTYLVTKNLANGSLVDVLTKEDEGNPPAGWDNKAKLKVALGVAVALAFVFGKEKKVQLTPFDVMLDENFAPMVMPLPIDMLTEEEESVFVTLAHPGSPRDIFVPPEFMYRSSDLLEPGAYQFAWVLYFIFAVGEKEWRELKDTRKPRSRAFVHRIVSGDRPRCPDSAPGIVRDMISMCWMEDPAERPSFVQIVEKLQECVENAPSFSKS